MDPFDLIPVQHQRRLTANMSAGVGDGVCLFVISRVLDDGMSWGAAVDLALEIDRRAHWDKFHLDMDALVNQVVERQVKSRKDNLDDATKLADKYIPRYDPT